MLVQGSKLHTPPANYHLLTAWQEPYIDHMKKAYILTKYI